MLSPGQRVYHEKNGWGTILTIKRRPGTKAGDTAWIKWETYAVSKPAAAGRAKYETNVYLSSLTPERTNTATGDEANSSPRSDQSVTAVDAATRPVVAANSLPTDTEPEAPVTVPAAEFSLPEEVSESVFVEGAVRTITVNSYERDPKIRQRCIAAHGTTCCVCGFSFAAAYGPEAPGFIHVHHLRPLSEVGGAHEVDPVEHLRPACPNCHAVLHRRVPAFEIEEVRGFLARQRQA